MASLSRDSKSGQWMVRICAPDGSRPTIRLGRLDAHRAADVHRLIGELVTAARNGVEPTAVARAWVTSLDRHFRRRLERAGLLEAEEADGQAAQVRDSARGCPTVAAWVDEYIEGRADLKQGTRINLLQAARDVKDFFGTVRGLDEVTPGDADAFRVFLHSQRQRKLGRGTAARRVKRARQFFAAAVKHRLIAENPFTGIKCGDFSDGRRFHFVTIAEAQAVLDACPDAEWRMIFALCRFGGLRCPSEVLGLKWEDVDWARERFAVHASKTEYVDGGTRHVPIFTELAPHLREAFDAAPDGAAHVVSGNRLGSENLRTQLTRIVKRAGVTPWPKIFQNCRSTRETELAERFPLHGSANGSGTRRGWRRNITSSRQRSTSSGPSGDRPRRRALQKRSSWPSQRVATKSKSRRKRPKKPHYAGI